MNAHEAIRFSIDMTEHLTQTYLADLSDAELLHRPAPGCNHINWQMGHLILAEYRIISSALPDRLPPLPDDFAARYDKTTAQSDDPAAFYTKEQLLALHAQQRAATLSLFAKTTDEELSTPCEGWTPTLGAVFSGAAGQHWLMHLGQWAVVRRQLGRPALF